MKAVFRFMLGLIPIIILFILLTGYYRYIQNLPSGLEALDESFVFLLFLYFGGSFFICFVTGIFVIKFSNFERVYTLFISLYLH